MIPSILKLDAGGQPLAWIRWQSAVTLYARNRVCWEDGEEGFRILGGVCARSGERSSFEVGSIIAVQDRSRKFASGAPLLTNRTLFQRPHNLRLYCGRQFHASKLTRDHIQPASHGGGSVWESCLTACPLFPVKALLDYRASEWIGGKICLLWSYWTGRRNQFHLRVRGRWPQ